ncbi:MULTISPECIES: TraR/DksA C4-type zinc finger protein [unclassified Clostridioides]|uniref:TraR/DksA C4-type zinc finger protein n=1 Tax=unclassified Clostridioides TaxID=2635829 RepID=UPI0006BBA93D|nr:transcriptional regulator [Clostridioides difficile]MCC0691109.1 TraR/DksA C4-type zinc finger protein [Clostridioides sp. ZZV14-6387]KPI50272.1 transcriptional regulator [Clostridioides difficile]MDB3085295.1 transcriptional regulator [Clostridioides difficile]MDI0266716.1 TraR/DksA C4-type zinc finger protein [Clostridioides difficile]
MDTKKYKDRLLKEKEKLTNLVVDMKDNTLFGDTTKHTSEKYSSGELSSYDNHIGDMGTDVYMQNMQNSLINHEEGRMYQIDLALSKIEDGTYGICDLCHKKIDLERLDILPDTNLCNSCANKNDDLLGDASENPEVENTNFYSEYLTDLTDLNKNELLKD